MAIITDADNKIDFLHVDNLQLDNNEIVSTSGSLKLDGSNDTIDVSDNRIILVADPTQDPRIGFIEQLILDCGVSGDILVYNIGFERGKLRA